MGKRAYFYAVITLAWVFFGLCLSARLFGKDSFAEISTVISCASIGTAISFSIEHAIIRLKANK